MKVNKPGKYKLEQHILAAGKTREAILWHTRSYTVALITPDLRVLRNLCDSSSHGFRRGGGGGGHSFLCQTGEGT